MSIDKAKTLEYTFPTSNQNLIEQCIRDIENHDYVLESKTYVGKDTKLVFKLKNQDLPPQK